MLHPLWQCRTGWASAPCRSWVQLDGAGEAEVELLLGGEELVGWRWPRGRVLARCRSVGFVARDARRWVDSGGVADVAAQGSGAVASSGAHRMPHWDVAGTTRSMGQRGQTISPLPDMDGVEPWVLVRSGRRLSA